MESSDRTRALWARLVGLIGVLCATAAASQTSGPAPVVASGPETRAQIVPVHAATLSSEMAGRIDGIATRPGDRFRKGDVLGDVRLRAAAGATEQGAGGSDPGRTDL